MELDDLKDSWKQSTQTIKLSNKNIMEMIQNKTYGPLSILKKRFRKQSAALAAVLILSCLNLMNTHGFLLTLIIYFTIVLAVVTLAFVLYGKKVIATLETNDTTVKENFESQVHKLEKSVLVRLWIARIMFVLLIISIELLMYFKEAPISNWENVEGGYRFLVYCCILLFIFVMTTVIFKFKFKRDIDYLKGLVGELKGE